MTLNILGLSHKTAPIDVRERLAFNPESLGPALDGLKARPGIAEAVILSTCNRTEIYCDLETTDLHQPLDWIK